MKEMSNISIKFSLPRYPAINDESCLQSLRTFKTNAWIISTIASDQELELQLNEQHENWKWEKMRFFNKIRNNWIILHVLSHCGC
ncbi:unnamed protein product [Caenorhabditis nigoni]